MLCGLTRIVSRIKHMIFFSFSKKYRPFEHLKCHECLWCKFFDDCKKEYDYMIVLDAVADSFHNGKTHAKHEEVVIGKPIESLDKTSEYYQWMKTYKDDTYGKSVSMNPADYINWNALWDYLDKHL